MTDTAISPLRRRMIEDMTIRKLGPKTQADYIRAVKNFAAFLGHSPDRATIGEDIRRYRSSASRPAWPRRPQRERGHDCAALLLQGYPAEGVTSPKTSCSPASPGGCRLCWVRKKWPGCWRRQRTSNTRRPWSIYAYGTGLRASEVIFSQGRRHR